MELTEKIANCHQMISENKKPLYEQDGRCKLSEGLKMGLPCHFLNPNQDEIEDVGIYFCRRSYS